MAAAPRAGRRAAGGGVGSSFDLGPTTTTSSNPASVSGSFASPSAAAAVGGYVPIPTVLPSAQQQQQQPTTTINLASAAAAATLTSPQSALTSPTAAAMAMGGGGFGSNIGQQNQGGANPSLMSNSSMFSGGAAPTPTNKALSPVGGGVGGGPALNLDGGGVGVGRRGAAAGRRSGSAAAGVATDDGATPMSVTLSQPSGTPFAASLGGGGGGGGGGTGHGGGAFLHRPSIKKDDDLDFLSDDTDDARRGPTPMSGTLPIANTHQHGQNPLPSRQQRQTAVSFVSSETGNPLAAAPVSMGRRGSVVSPASNQLTPSTTPMVPPPALAGSAGGDSFLYDDDFVDESFGGQSVEGKQLNDTTASPTSFSSQSDNNLLNSKAANATQQRKSIETADDDLDSLFGGGSEKPSQQHVPTASAAGVHHQRGSAASSTTAAAAGGGGGYKNSNSSSTAVASSSAEYQALLKEVEELRALAAKPKSLEEQHDELLAELHTVEGQLLKQTIKTNTVEHTVRRERENNGVALSSKRVDLVRQQASADAKMRESASYAQRRIADIRSKGEKELAELTQTHTQMLQDRNDRILFDLRNDIKLVTSELAKLESQKELLLQNGTFDAAPSSNKPSSSSSTATKDPARAVYVKLLDAKTIDAKVDVALNMLMEQHKAIDEKLEKKIGNFIHLESSALIGETWEERHSLFVKESIARRDAFSLFKTELLEKTSQFHNNRHDARRGDVNTIHDLVKRNIEDVRERTIAVTQRAEQECRARFEELSAKLKAQYAQAITAKEAQKKALLAEDDRLYAAQIAETSSRHGTSLRLQDKLHTEEAQTLHALLARELERSVALKGTSAAMASTQLKDVGWRYEEAQDHSKVLRELLAKVSNAVEKQLERNNAYKATGVGATPAATAAYSAGSGSPIVPMTGLTAEEAHLVSLFAEKQAALDGVQRAVRDQMDQLGANREGLGTLVEAFEVKLTTLMREMHEARLSQQTQLSKSEAIRAQWEREHRAMLSHKHVQAVGGGDSSDPRDVYGLHPSLGIALQLASTVRNAAVAQQEKYTSFCEKRNIILQTQRQSDAASAEDGMVLQQMREKFLAAVLKLNEETTQITEKQVTVLSEQAKLGVERELLEHEKRALEQKASTLDRDAKEVGSEYEKIRSNQAAVSVQSQQIEREQDAANRELRTLVVLQGDLRHQQAEHHAQANRLERMKQRLLGVWGHDAAVDGATPCSSEESYSFQQQQRRGVGGIDGTMLSNATRNSFVGNPYYQYLDTNHQQRPPIGSSSDENCYPRGTTTTTTTTSSSSQKAISSSDAEGKATRKQPATAPTLALQTQKPSNANAYAAMNRGGGSSGAVSSNPPVARGSMAMGRGVGGGGKDDSDDDEDERTDAFSEQNATRITANNNNDNTTLHLNNTSVFTQLRHVSPSMNTSVAPSLDTSPMR